MEQGSTYRKTFLGEPACPGAGSETWATVPGTQPSSSKQLIMGTERPARTGMACEEHLWAWLQLCALGVTVTPEVEPEASREVSVSKVVD